MHFPVLTCETNKENVHSFPKSIAKSVLLPFFDRVEWCVQATQKIVFILSLPFHHYTKQNVVPYINLLVDCNLYCVMWMWVRHKSPPTVLKVDFHGLLQKGDNYNDKLNEWWSVKFPVLVVCLGETLSFFSHQNCTQKAHIHTHTRIHFNNWKRAILTVQTVSCSIVIGKYFLIFWYMRVHANSCLSGEVKIEEFQEFPPKSASCFLFVNHSWKFSENWRENFFIPDL